MSALIDTIERYEADSDNWWHVIHIMEDLFPREQIHTRRQLLCDLLQELADRRAKDIPDIPETWYYGDETGCKYCHQIMLDNLTTSGQQIWRDFHAAKRCESDALKALTYDERDMRKMKEAEAAQEFAAGLRNRSPNGDLGITPEVTLALAAAAESFYDLRALLERLHLLAPEATDHTAEIRIRDILNKYAVSLPNKHQAYRPFEEPSSKV